MSPNASTGSPIPCVGTMFQQRLERRLRALPAILDHLNEVGKDIINVTEQQSALNEFAIYRSVEARFFEDSKMFLLISGKRLI